MWGQPPQLSSRATLGGRLVERKYTCCSSQTKQDFSQRREESECSRPWGERLPLVKAYPEAEWPSMAGKPGDLQSRILGGRRHGPAPFPLAARPAFLSAGGPH